MAGSIDRFYHYLPVNDDAMRWGLYVTGVGREVVPAGADYPPKGHPSLYDFQWQQGRVLPEFQVILITDGHGRFESEPTGVVTVESGSVLFLLPGQWHRYRPDKATGWTERWISLNGELPHRLLELKLLGPRAPVGRAKAPATLAAAFDEFLERVHADPTQNSILLSLQAMAIFGAALEGPIHDDASLEALRQVRAHDVRDPLVAEGLDLIWSHSHRAISVEQIAARLAISRRALERHFRRALGHTVFDEINACRLGRAKRLLRETELSVKAIASLSGFSSDERMRVAFVQSEGVSPAVYRSKARSGQKHRKHRL